MNFYLFVLGVLSVWRITHLLYAEDGPWALLVKLRSRAGHGLFGGLLDCFYCLSLWIAVPFAFLIGDTWRQRLLLWLSLSAGAILIQRLASSQERGTAVYFTEDKEKPDVMLRAAEEKISRTNVGTGV